MTVRVLACTAAIVAALVGGTVAKAAELPVNDYPTYARADYVFACMQTNGQTREALEKCACSIDEVAALPALRRVRAGGDDHVGAPEGRRERHHVQQLCAASGEGEEPEARPGRSRAALLLRPSCRGCTWCCHPAACPGIQRSASAEPRRGLDPGNKCRDDCCGRGTPTSTQLSSSGLSRGPSPTLVPPAPLCMSVASMTAVRNLLSRGFSGQARE